jgi:hypothetical protein
MNKNEMGRSCGMYAYRVLWALGERDHPEDLGTDGRIILKCFLKK